MEENMGKNRLTIILQGLLIFAIFLFIGMLLFDLHSAKVMDSSLSAVVDELDKKIEENKKIAQEQTNEKNEDVQPEATNEMVETVIKPVDMSVKIGNSIVLGKIKIDKIGI